MKDMDAAYSLLAELMERISYKPGYEFALERLKTDAARVSLTCLTLPNSYDPAATTGLTIMNGINLRTIATSADALQAFATVVARYELHETAEWFKCDRRTVFDAHARGDSFGEFLWSDFTSLGGLYLRALKDALDKQDG
ncbi:MAG TPA: hypothetical protein VHZ03_34095 [Trebonia sp.]|nr:hypothetical protein [Trebonia sp.]